MTRKNISPNQSSQHSNNYQLGFLYRHLQTPSPPLLTFADFFATVTDFSTFPFRRSILPRPLLHRLTRCHQQFLNFAQCFQLFQAELHFN